MRKGHLFGLLLMLIFGAAQTARAQDYVGTYDYAKDWKERGNNYTVRYSLDINRNGRYELAAERSGARPRRGDREIRAFGSLLNDLDRRRVTETGEWSARGNQITLFAQHYNGGRDDSTYRAEFRGKDVALVGFSRERYGQAELKFRRRDANGGGGNNGGGNGGNPGDSNLAGSIWQASLDLPDNPGGRLTRRLTLSARGDASLVTEYGGSDAPNKTANALRSAGNLLNLLDARTRTFSHTGTWDSRNGIVTLRLTKIGLRPYADTLTFRVSGRTLTSVRINRDTYGDASFSFARTR